MGRGYTYNNSSRYAGDHHDALAELLDPITQQRIQGLLQLPGKRCLDVGAGGGSIARWLAGEVAPAGLVCATDLDTSRLPEWPGLVVMQHDISARPMPADLRGFDLVHVRLVLNHVPQRDAALHHMVQALKPGGVLLTADFMPTRSRELAVSAPSEPDLRLLRRFQFFHLQILKQNGNDRTWSERAAASLRGEGLVDVHEETDSLGEWRGGGTGCRLLLAGLRQLELKFEANGWTQGHLRRVAELLADPAVVLKGYDLHNVSGWKAMPENTPWPIN